jgi:hypothetical protein
MLEIVSMSQLTKKLAALKLLLKLFNWFRGTWL